MAPPRPAKRPACARAGRARHRTRCCRRGPQAAPARLRAGTPFHATGRPPNRRGGEQLVRPCAAPSRRRAEDALHASAARAVANDCPRPRRRTPRGTVQPSTSASTSRPSGLDANPAVTRRPRADIRSRSSRRARTSGGMSVFLVMAITLNSVGVLSQFIRFRGRCPAKAAEACFGPASRAIRGAAGRRAARSRTSGFQLGRSGPYKAAHRRRHSVSAGSPRRRPSSFRSRGAPSGPPGPRPGQQGLLCLVGILGAAGGGKRRQGPGRTVRRRESRPRADWNLPRAWRSALSRREPTRRVRSRTSPGPAAESTSRSRKRGPVAFRPAQGRPAPSAPAPAGCAAAIRRSPSARSRCSTSSGGLRQHHVASAQGKKRRALPAHAHQPGAGHGVLIFRRSTKWRKFGPSRA